MNSPLSATGWLQLALFFVVLIICIKPLGAYMANVYEGKTTFMHKPLRWLESGFYRLVRMDENEEMPWQAYALNVLVFSLVSLIGLYALLRLQDLLPLNPAGMAAVPPHLAFNTAVSFVSNTNWQSYGGESTLSYLSQMLGLTVQNFVSAGVGMAVMVALVRGFVRINSKTIGNFWTDLVRSVVYILLPLSVLLAVVLGSQGVVQTFKPYVEAQLLEPTKDADGNEVTTQTIAVGPAASQIAIKQLGTNGGGFFNANSAHPLENPTPLSNFLEMLSIILIPAALCFTFGSMVKDNRQGWVLFAAMTIIFVPLTIFGVMQEQKGNPLLTPLGVDQVVSDTQSGGNMEGKETRSGIANSVLWATTTTAASNGSVNAMHDSFTPLGGLVPMILMQFGEVIYGGVGSGMYGMLVFVMLTVFIAGLMVGRTPEYLGKKIQAFEIKMASVVILIVPLFVLVSTAIAVSLDVGKAGILNPGAQGFSEILYAFTSAANNNGSAFGGLTANTPFYNTMLGFAMLFGRFWIIVPVLAIAGSLAAKRVTPVSAGTLPTHTPLFIGLLVGVIVLVGVLTYVPALALGPIAEHFHMLGIQK